MDTTSDSRSWGEAQPRDSQGLGSTGRNTPKQTDRFWPELRPAGDDESVGSQPWEFGSLQRQADHSKPFNQPNLVCWRKSLTIVAPPLKLQLFFKGTWPFGVLFSLAQHGLVLSMWRATMGDTSETPCGYSHSGELHLEKVQSRTAAEISSEKKRDLKSLAYLVMLC